MTSQELKHLQVAVTQAKSALETARVAAAQAQRKKAQCEKAFKNATAELEAAKTSSMEPTVSEHAILRLVERVYGLDMKTFTDSILSEKTKSLIKHFKSGKFPIEEYNCVAVVKNGTVVTILD